ncbi:MAG: hypothetical protein OEV09_14110, partial [Deltaproteobacteria bacterium]|nr:hypothetical protein [Deltaproteobacteria bacterium]
FAFGFRTRYLAGGFTESWYFTTLSAEHSRLQLADVWKSPLLMTWITVVLFSGENKGEIDGIEQI